MVRISANYTSPRAEPMPIIRDGAPCLWQWLRQDDDNLALEFTVGAEFRVFEGHYPGQPIFPGVYLLETACQMLEQHAGASGAPRPCLHKVKSLRLMSPVLPSMRLQCEAKPLLDKTTGQRFWEVAFTHQDEVMAKTRLHFVPDRQAVSDGDTGTRSGIDHIATPADVSHNAMADDDTIRGAADILGLLRHRHPILLVDKIIWHRPGDALHAVKAISLNEPCYQYCQAQPLSHLGFPRSLITESFIQSAALFLAGADANPRTSTMLLGGVSNVEFFADALPGDLLHHHVKLERQVGDTAIISGLSQTNEEVVARYEQIVVAQRSLEESATA